MRILDYVFSDIDEAIRYIAEYEKIVLEKERPKNPPLIMRNTENMFNQPFDERIMKESMVSCNSIEYPFAAFYNGASEDEFIINKLFTGRYALKPNLRKRAFLFRGENEFHSPSYPSIFRVNKETYLEDMILIDEMSVLLMNHPLVKLLHNGVEINGKKMAFEMNTLGLAQHYETKTELMDLTSDINVAAFFATSWYDGKVYKPIEDESKLGVIYLFKLDMDSFSPKYVMENKPTLHTIGLQLFPRSGQQKGFLFNMCRGFDFNEQKEVTILKFYHNAEKSKYYFEMMDGGRRLFPSDILADYCNSMDRHVVSYAAIKSNLRRNSDETFESIKTKLENLNFTITLEEPMFSTEYLEKFYSDLHNGGWMHFCEQIHIPKNCPEITQSDLLNLIHRDEYRSAFGYN